MKALDTEFGFGCGRPYFLMKISSFFNKIFLNRYFSLFLFCLGSLVIVTKKEVLGAAIFVGIICMTLVLCEDILASALPFLILCVFVTNCYGSYDTFIRYVWLAIPAVFSILFHFIVYRRKIQIGSSFLGVVLVALALMLGGIGVLSPKEYFAPGTLYYTLGLGIGMVVLYLLLKSQLCVKRSYDVQEKCLSLLYVMGIFSIVMVLFFISQNTEYIHDNKMLPDWQPSNNISTVLMFALPCPFFFLTRSRVHVLSIFAMYGAILLTGSRSGFLMGTVELFCCIFIAAIWHKKFRFAYVCFGIGLLGLLYLFGEKILAFTAHVEIDNLINHEEARFKLIFRAKELFLQYPILGHGLGYQGNVDLYNPVKGAMTWYHMMIPQVMASMGTVGIVAYVLQFVLQARCVAVACIKNKGMEQRGLILTLASSYVGVLLMSQVNPGLFCPLPYALLAVLIFALIDGKEGPLPFRIGKKH